MSDRLKLNEEEQVVRDRLNKPRMRPFKGMTGEPIPPPSPEMFRQDPPVPFDREIQAAIQAIQRIAPEAFANVDRITSGPTEGVIELLLANGMDPAREFDETNLMGQWDNQLKSIFLRPSKLGVPPNDISSTLVHELMHAQGYRGHPPEIKETQETYERSKVAKRKPSGK